MKKILFTLFMLGTLAFAVPAFATTAFLSPGSVSVKPGQIFTVSIVVNPAGMNNYVEKVELKYPADILQVNSFTLGNTWMALTQPGYDLTDNTNGILLKSAGYPSGFSSAALFGTVSFTAKKAGSGNIAIGNNSLAFEANSQSVITGSPVSFTATAPVPVSLSSVIPSLHKQPANIISALPPATKQPISITSAPPSATEQPDNQNIVKNSLAAAIVGGASFRVLAAVIILVCVIYALFRKKRKKSG